MSNSSHRRSKTKRGKNIPHAKIISDHVAEQISALKKQVGSPSLAVYLMQYNLIDEFWLFINPIILGEGISLFRDLKKEIKLKLIKNISFKGGVIATHYSLEA